MKSAFASFLTGIEKLHGKSSKRQQQISVKRGILSSHVFLALPSTVFTRKGRINETNGKRYKMGNELR